MTEEEHDIVINAEIKKNNKNNYDNLNGGFVKIQKLN